MTCCVRELFCFKQTRWLLINKNIAKFKCVVGKSFKRMVILCALGAAKSKGKHWRQALLRMTHKGVMHVPNLTVENVGLKRRFWRR